MKPHAAVVAAFLTLTAGGSWLLSGSALATEEPANLTDPTLWEDQNAAPPVVLGSGAIVEESETGEAGPASGETDDGGAGGGEAADPTWTLTQTTYADTDSGLSGTCYSIEVDNGAVESCTPGEFEPDASEPILVSVGDSERIELTLALPTQPLGDEPEAVGTTLVDGEELRWEIRQQAG